MAETADDVRVRDRLRYDTPFWARNCATILTEERIPVRLDARPWQLQFDAALEKQRRAGQPMRAIILKARKLGFSTWVQARFLQRVTQMPNRYALVAAQDRKTAGVLMDMARYMYEHLPTEEELGIGFSIKPQIVGQGQSRGSGGRWMSFGDRRRPHEASVYETLTAGATASGRGYTPDMFHGSEVAHYDDANFLVGALSAVPQRPETQIILESTANGFNAFHDMWQRAVAGAEDEDLGGYYVPLFFGWQDNPFNARQFISVQARDRFERTLGDPDGGGDEEELLFRESFGVTPRAAVLAADRPQRRPVRRQRGEVPPGASGYPGAGVHRLRSARVLRDPRRAGAEGSRVRGEARGGRSAGRRHADEGAEGADGRGAADGAVASRG
jgi:hypothetical protein